MEKDIKYDNHNAKRILCEQAHGHSHIRTFAIASYTNTFNVVSTLTYFGLYDALVSYHALLLYMCTSITEKSRLVIREASVNSDKNSYKLLVVLGMLYAFPCCCKHIKKYINYPKRIHTTYTEKFQK